MTDLYVFAPHEQLERASVRPLWFSDSGVPLTDDQLADHGWFPVLEPAPIPAGKIVVATEIVFADAAWRVVNELADAPPEPPPEIISDRQFAQQLAILGIITEAEAIAWAARGELPDAMENAVAALPSDQQFGARMLLASATTYERSHPLVPVMGAILEYDAVELDELWRAAAVL